MNIFHESSKSVEIACFLCYKSLRCAVALKKSGSRSQAQADIFFVIFVPSFVSFVVRRFPEKNIPQI